MKAEIIAIGSELLTPDRLDTNSLFLTEEFNAIGIEVVRKTVVGDNRDLLAEAFRDALNRVPLIGPSPPLESIRGSRINASRNASATRARIYTETVLRTTSIPIAFNSFVRKKDR